jgi:rhamnosyltransferase
MLTLAGCSLGKITYIDDKLFLYRQHQNNVTGNMEVHRLKRILRAFSSIKEKYVTEYETNMGIRSFLDTHIAELSKNDKNLIENFLDLSAINPLGRMCRIIWRGYSLGGSRIHLWIKVATRKFSNIE